MLAAYQFSFVDVNFTTYVHSGSRKIRYTNVGMIDKVALGCLVKVHQAIKLSFSTLYSTLKAKFLKGF